MMLDLVLNINIKESCFQREDKYLCKRPQGDSHFRGHVSPMNSNMSPIYFYVTCADTWFSDFFSFFDRSGCVYPPEVDAYTSLSSFN